MKLVVVAVFVSLLAVAACERATQAEEQAAVERMWPRPFDVPPTAVLHAGEDGGHWSDCRFVASELSCDIYHVRGGLDFRQSYRVCIDDEPGSLAGGVMGGEDRGFAVGRRKVFLVPASPPEFSPDEPEIQQKVDREFEALQPLECAVQLVPTAE